MKTKILILKDTSEPWPAWETHTVSAESFVTFADGKVLNFYSLPEVAKEKLSAAGASSKKLHSTQRLSVSCTVEELLA